LAEPSQTPIGTEHFKQARGRYGQAFSVVFPITDVDDHALGIDVFDPKATDLTDS
jgi:hypothetical protein